MVLLYLTQFYSQISCQSQTKSSLFLFYSKCFALHIIVAAFFLLIKTLRFCRDSNLGNLAFFACCKEKLAEVLSFCNALLYKFLVFLLFFSLFGPFSHEPIVFLFLTVKSLGNEKFECFFVICKFLCL